MNADVSEKEMTTLATVSTKKKLSTKVAAVVTVAKTVAPVPALPPPVAFRLADLRPGKLLLLEFSRPGGSTKDDPEYADEASDDETPKKKRKKLPANKAMAQIEQWSLKVVNNGYARLISHFAHVDPWGFFCLDEEVSSVEKVLKEIRQAAAFVNKLAIERNSPRRVRIDFYPITWDHTDPLFRQRVGEMIAERLIDLREAYTSKLMWTFRVRFDKAKNIHRLVVGQQVKLIQDALESTKAQRKIMVALYGDKCPIDWTDPNTGELREDIRLDFTAIDRAIHHFCPSWEPPTAIGFVP